MPLDQAQWQIDILAADKTAAAFASVERRMKQLDATTKASTATMATQGAASANAFALIGRAAAPLVGILGSLNVVQRAWDAGMRSGALIDQAAQLGTTTDALQAFRLAAAQSGVAAEQFDGALQRLTGQVGQAGAGSDEAIARFDRLGVKLLDTRGQLRPINDLLPEVARGLKGVASETERNALAQEMFGRSGSRIVTMLDQLARGTEAVTASARAQGAIVEKDVLEAWNKLDAQIKTTSATFDTLLATFGAPIATGALEHFNAVLRSTYKEIEAIAGVWRWLSSGPSVQTLTDRESSLRGQLQELDKRGEGQSGSADMIRRKLAALAENRAGMAADGAGIYVGDTVRFTGTSGAGQPTGNKARSAGESDAARQLRETQKAMDDLFDSIEKIRKASEGVGDRFGNGMAYAARETAELNEMLTMGFIDAGTHARALEDVTRQSDDMARAFRGAAGGWDGFQAGLEQGLADMSRANTAFEMGKQLVDQMSDSLTDLATGAEVDFNKILDSFLSMLIQMELRAAASNIFNAISGKGATDQGIGGLIGGLFGGAGGASTASGPLDGLFTSLMGSPFGFADGGRPPVGVPSIVGERGPELFMPDRAGTIVPNHMLGGAGGMNIRISLDSALLRAVVVDESGRVVARATPRIVSAAVDRSREEVVPTMARFEAERGGDYRG